MSPREHTSIPQLYVSSQVPGFQRLWGDSETEWGIDTPGLTSPSKP